MSKKVAVSTWCTDDYREYIGIEQLSNSIKHFHPEIDHHINSEKWTPEGGNWMMAPTCLEIADDYDMVIHVDGDAVIVGDLSEMISSDADVVGARNNNAYNKAGGNDGITTPHHLYDPLPDRYVATGRMIPLEDWLNAGIIAANNKAFWEAWHDFNMQVTGHRTGADLSHIAPPVGDENDTLNLVYFSNRFSTHTVDAIGSNVHYNISTLWSPGPYMHYESWKKLYIKDDKVYLNDPLSKVPSQVKILHQAGGSYANHLNKSFGGFRQWLRQAVPPEVAEFIDHVSN